MPGDVQDQTGSTPNGATDEVVTPDLGHAGELSPAAIAQRIQDAIDACADAGGGIVRIPRGGHVTATIRLRSHVHLDLAVGARLIGSADLADYPIVVPGLRSYTDNYVNRSVIYAEGATDIGIGGHGELDGNGAAFVGAPYLERPYVLRFVDCERVRVRDITIRDSAMWVQHYLGCRDVLLDGLTVASKANVNNDGIDIDSCERVRISNCDIATEDDAIVIKATADRPCRDIVVTNCVLQSDCSAFKIGTETVGDITDVVFSNSTIRDTRLSALAVETVDGSRVERVLISNLAIRDVNNHLFVRLGHRGRPVEAVDTGDCCDDYLADRRPVGSLADITIADIRATGGDGFGMSITGLPDSPVRRVTVRNAHFGVAGGGAIVAGVEELPWSYPEYTMFGPTPSSGLFARHVVGLVLDDVRFDLAAADARPPIVLDDVAEARIETSPEMAAGATGPAT